MKFSPETRLVIDPQLRLRKDHDRAVLLTKPQPLSNRNNFTYILHPRRAVMLALFDGQRTLSGVKSLWAELFDLPIERADSEVDQVVQLYDGSEKQNENIFVEVDNDKTFEISHYDPQDFIVSQRKIDMAGTRLRIPYTVYYLPTLFCPQKCVYCYAKTLPRPEPERDFISLGRLREIFAELAALDVDVINLSGGDPLARRDIYEIIASIIELGMTPDIPTKVGLSYRRIHELKELGVPLLQVSLDSTNPGILDQMVGVPGYHRKAFRLLEDLRRAEMPIRVNTVVTPLNLPTLGELADYLGQLGNVRKVIFSPYGRSMFCHQDSLFVSSDQLKKLEQQLTGKDDLYPHMKIMRGSPAPTIPEDKKKRREAWQQRALCTANRHGFVILPDGRVTVCEELYDHPEFIIGDLKTQSVMEMWRSPEALALIHPDQSAVPNGPCKTCGNFKDCNAERGRCWRDVLKSYGWAKPHYPDPRCPMAPPGPRLG